MAIGPHIRDIHFQAGDVNQIYRRQFWTPARRKSSDSDPTTLIQKCVAQHEFAARRFRSCCCRTAHIDPRQRCAKSHLAEMSSQAVIKKDRICYRELSPISVFDYGTIGAAIRRATEKHARFDRQFAFVCPDNVSSSETGDESECADAIKLAMADHRVIDVDQIQRDECVCHLVRSTSERYVLHS